MASVIYVHRIQLVVLAVVALVMSLGVACGGGGDDKTPTATATAVVETEKTSAPAQAEGETITVGKSFWHAGWKVTIKDATLEPGDLTSAAVVMNATFENLSDNTGSFDSQLALSVGGNNYTDESLTEDIPQVPGKAKGNGTIAIAVDDEFTFDDAVLTIGNSSNNQARIPIGPDATGATVTLEPRTIAVTGTVVAGGVTLTVTGAELRADLPDVQSEVEKGKKALTVRFSVTVAPGIPIGEGVLQDQNVNLKLPDGTSVAVRSDGRSGVNELLQGKKGTTISDLSVRFEVPDPGTGAFALVLKGRYDASREIVQAELPFTIAAATP